MKKVLLTLLLLLSLGFAASAQVTDVLTTENFTGISYTTAKSWTSTASKASYEAKASSNNGFQMRSSKKGCIIRATSAPDGFIISSIKITMKRAGGGVTVYSSDEVITADALPATSIGATGDASSKEFTINKPYFAIVPTNDTYCQVSNVEVTWVSLSGPECPEPVFDIEDGAQVFAGQTINASYINQNATCTLSVNGESQEGLSYTIPADAKIGSTITLSATTKLEGADPETITKTITVIVAERPLEAMFDWESTFSGFKTGNSNNIISEIESKTIGEATLTVAGRHVANSDADKQDLRLFKASGTDKAGNITLSVKEGFYITKIEIVGTNLSNTDASELWTNDDINVKSHKITATGSAYFKSITVKYTKCPTEVLGMGYVLTGQKQAIKLDYTLHVKNHQAGEAYKIGISVDGGAEEFVEIEEPAALENGEEAANAPMRAIIKDTFGTSEGATHKTEGTHKIVVNEETAGDHNVKMTVYHNDEKALDIPVIVKNTTTGIEDVAVDGEQAAPEYYTLQGVRVAQPQAGQIYIVRRGAKATKELVK